MNLLKEFFILNRSTINNKLSGECKLCRKQYADRTGSTGNFHKHLKRKHFMQYQQAKFGDDTIIPQEDFVENEEDLRDNVVKINRIILTELIVRCNLPPTLVEHVGFRSFLKAIAPRWKPTSARYFTRTLLPTLMNDCQNKIKKILDDINHISITVDVWTDRRGRSFIGVTGHFLDENFVSQAVLLNFVRLKGSHTAENIRHVTEEILENLKIRHKVFRVITDNASSMIKAYKFGLNVSDNPLQVEQCNKERRGKEGQDVVDLFTTYSDDDDDDFSTLGEWQFVDWNESEKSSIDTTEQYIPSRISCFAHSLQLTIRDGLKGTPYLSRSLSKCMQLTRKSYKSIKITELLEEIGKTINRSNITRWNSEYLMIKSIIALGKRTIDEITDIIDDDELKFTHHDFIVLQEAVDILEPFAEITSRIQSESMVTISLVVPSIVHIIDHLKNIKLNLSLLTKTCEQLEQSVVKRFAGILKRLYHQTICSNDPFSDPIYFICAVLDPEFKFYWINQIKYDKEHLESQMKQSLIQLILNECKSSDDRSLDKFDSKESSLCTSNDNMTQQSFNRPVSSKRKLFHYEDDSNGGTLPQLKISPMNEINAYLNDSTRVRFSTYWKNTQFSHLKMIVKRVFSVQASSAPVERVFSQAGLIMSPRRTMMLKEVFRSLVFLHVNQRLFP